MRAFYSEPGRRAPYQAMLARQEDAAPPPDSVRNLLPDRLAVLAPERVLEVGCGDGRLFRQIRDLGFTGGYTGIDMSAGLAAANRVRHPAARWTAGSVEHLPFADDTFDACFSLYVLEHTVHPERALESMVRVVRPGGHVLLVFPDFVAGGIFPSHPVGLSAGGTAREKLGAGRVLDALVSLYDSRVRLPRLLARASERHGPFPVNARPLCLEDPPTIAPDTDAVYIASKHEVAAWARSRGHTACFPAGIEGELRDQAFVDIEVR